MHANRFKVFNRYSEGKNNNIFRNIFRHCAFINYIILYNKTYAKIHYKSYNNFKCYHRYKINNLPIKKLLTCLLNCNEVTELNNYENNDIKQVFEKYITHDKNEHHNNIKTNNI